MFDLFKSRKKVDDMIEEIKQNQPYAEPERQYYSLGPTNEGRVMLKVYYGNISMDKEGIDSFINVLEASKMWLEDRSGKQPEDGCQEAQQPV